MPERIVIAGGGIVGVACGIALRLFGYEVVIYALDSILDADAMRSPSFLAGSIIPNANLEPCSAWGRGTSVWQANRFVVDDPRG